MSDKKIRTMVTAAVLAALSCVATMVVQIPSPMNGFVNLGDCFVLLSGWLLGPWWGAAAGGIGSMLADLLLGYGHYAPGTLIIKGAMALVAALIFKAFKKNTAGALVGGVAAEVVMVAGYFGYAALLLGKGIGYGRKAGEPIERQPSDRVFLPLSNPDAQPMLELFSSIPASYLELTQDIVDDAEQSLGVKLSAHIYLLLTDHLHFAVERQQKGLVVTNRIFWEIKHFYPKEYAVGQRGLQKVKAKLGIELPDEEAGNIAFHIVNARQDPQAGYDAMRAAQLIGELSNIVTYSMHCPVSTESIHYARFVSHLQYFAERFFSGKLMDSEDDFLFQQMQQNYPAAVTCAEKIRTFVLRKYGVFLPNEETAYLALHVARLTSGK